MVFKKSLKKEKRMEKINVNIILQKHYRFNSILMIFLFVININFLAMNCGPENPEILKYNLIFLGDQRVGKSCILNRFVNDTFSEEKKYEATMGLDSGKKDVQIDNQNIRLLLYDATGQEKFRSLIPMYTKDANIILLVYDVTSEESFIHLSDWLKDLTNIKKEDVIFAVVGNKRDLNDRIEISAEEGKKFAERQDFIFAEVSAKTGYGINNLFKEQIFPKIKEKFLDKINHIDNLDINNKKRKKTEKSSYASCLRKCFFCC